MRCSELQTLRAVMDDTVLHLLSHWRVHPACSTAEPTPQRLVSFQRRSDEISIVLRNPFKNEHTSIQPFAL